MRQKSKKILSIILMLSMLLGLTAMSSAEPAEDCTLLEHMEYLVNYVGQRLAGTPNEDMAAEYIRDKFVEYGYTNVEWAKPARTSVTTGRVVFSDGSGDILGHELQIFTDRYTPSDEGLIPTGEIAAVKGTPFDFTVARPIGEDIHKVNIGGYDHNFVLGEQPDYAANPRVGVLHVENRIVVGLFHR